MNCSTGTLWILAGLLTLPVAANAQPKQPPPPGGSGAIHIASSPSVAACPLPSCQGAFCETRGYVRLVRALRKAFQSAGEANVLILSGGGSRGAWGAGVLNGWSSSTKSPERPEFSLVTGVSTGAVQATAAFLGQPEDDLTLKTGYTTTENDDVYGFPYPFSKFPRNLKALRGTLAEDGYVPDSVIDRVADVANKSDRKLYVGTVDLQTGDFVSWDMTCIAQAKDYSLYREVILASSANPAGIWPIELRGHKHADGGVRYRIYSETLLRASDEAASNLAGLSARRLYYIINGKLWIKEESVSDWCFTDVMMRGLDIAMKEATFGSLYAAWHLMNGSGIDWEFLGSSIPKSVTDGISLPNSDDYEPSEMIPLFDAGVTSGQENDWTLGLPLADREKWGCEEGQD